ncbi:MAG: hypothetical protein K8W52_31285 [Deltaproteobacteria bacterium]|nr:hypothetical protein [Deltaproteobacteria bacterium]
MDDLGPSAQELLRAARDARTPSAADRARLHAAISAGIAAGAAGAGAASAAGAAASTATAGAWWTATWVKVIALAVALGGATVVTVAVVAPGSREASPSAPVALVAAIDAGPPAIVPDALIAAIAPVAPIDVPPAEPARPAVRAPHRPPASTPATSDLAAELELLHQAQRAWRSGDAAGALVLLDRHLASFRGSQLASERTALRILALCDVGRRADARALAARWLKTAGHSPARRSVEESCAAR